MQSGDIEQRQHKPQNSTTVLATQTGVIQLVRLTKIKWISWTFPLFFDKLKCKSFPTPTLIFVCSIYNKDQFWTMQASIYMPGMKQKA